MGLPPMNEELVLPLLPQKKSLSMLTYTGLGVPTELRHCSYGTRPPTLLTDTEQEFLQNCTYGTQSLLTEMGHWVPREMSVDITISKVHAPGLLSAAIHLLLFHILN